MNAKQFKAHVASIIALRETSYDWDELHYTLTHEQAARHCGVPRQWIELVAAYAMAVDPVMRQKPCR